MPVTVEAGNKASAELADTVQFLNLLTSISTGSDLSAEHATAHGMFNWQQGITVARAPGRLDVMGGIADYSGSLVLQMPIAEACHVALQRQHTATGGDGEGAHPEAKKSRTSPVLRIVSLHADEHRSPAFEAPLEELFPGGKPLPYEQAKAYFKRNLATSWAAYVAGCLLVLAHEEPEALLVEGAPLFTRESLAVLVSSEVPEGKGVSSSAAVEVATMSALLGALQAVPCAAAAGTARIDGRRLAILCQKVENLVVGAPCGIMDQMASALGEPGQLLALLCQPAEVQGCVRIPPNIAFWGVDSGVRHSVGGSDYGSVRVGAFMGLAVASKAAGTSSLGTVKSGYLANVSPSEYAELLEAALPGEVLGSEFLTTYGPHLDSVTSVEADQRYAVRVPSAHPIHEHFRVRSFQAGLLGPEGTPAQRELLGELMLQSHASYSACKLGSPGTDRLVQLVREEMAAVASAGEAPALFGAKITGGGCGGTVCILGVSDAAGQAAVDRVVGRYTKEQQLAQAPKVFKGSSMGAVAFGHVTVRINK